MMRVTLLAIIAATVGAITLPFEVVNRTEVGDVYCDPTQHNPAQLCPTVSSLLAYEAYAPT